MDNIRFEYHSARSEKARIAACFNKFWIVSLIIATVFILAAGIALLITRSAIGWALIGFSVVPAMIVQWYNGELHHLPINSDPHSIDDVMSGTVLGRLSKQPTPHEVAEVVSSLPGGQFMAVRFGIGAGFLKELTADGSYTIQDLWQVAWSIRNQTGSENISAAVLAAALVHCHPNNRVLLNHLQLEMEDLIYGVEWYVYLRDLIKSGRQPKRTGGLARDWSFGWTPLLDRYGDNISRRLGVGSLSSSILAPHKDSVNQLIDIFSKNGRQAIALVGPEGVGKTEIVRDFASRLLDATSVIPKTLRFRQVFMLDASTLIAAASDRGGLERLIPRLMNEAYGAKNVIICLDNAQLFFQDGIGSVDIANVLRPIIQAGNLRIILAMDEQNLLKIGQSNPDIINALTRVNVTEPSRMQTIGVMEYQTIFYEFENNVTYMYQALVEAYKLGDRYMYDMVMPRKALKLLELAAHYSNKGLVTAESVRQAIEQTLNVKVGVANTDIERDKLLNLENLIHQHMINQTRAVQVVSDALRRARAGVRNQNRPIGTFLFLGPTGVGKTELAKALANVYFDGADHIVRLDMNEYTTAADVQRMIADGADNANSLTAMVMKQPFSVVLLDEIEKAHPDVLSTLLQMLDEGVMRDIKNREISFRDVIVIATSNAGADRIREYIERGYDLGQFEDKFTDELINSKQFRPEFLNRFDEIVIFRPLKKPELLQVVELMLVDVNKTLAQQKVSVNVTADAKSYLVEAGYDPRLGARPMRRIIQRAVENTVAKRMLSGDVEPGSVIEISLDEVKQIIESKNQADQIAGTNS